MRVTLLSTVFIACVSCGGSSSGPQYAGPAWNLAVDTDSAGSPLSSALLGVYDLSGALYDYANVPGLVDAMGGVGADWRVGLGRWEIGTELFDLLSIPNPTLCRNVTDETRSAFNPDDLALITSRDWFSYTNGFPVTVPDIVDARFNLDYIRSVIDQTTTFGAKPFVSVDYMPRALSVTKTPDRRDCTSSFTNSVNNNRPQDPDVFAAALAGLVQRVVEGTGAKTGSERPRDAQYWEIWNEPELALFWQPTLQPGPNADLFFDMATKALQQLDSYRTNTPDSVGQSIRIGLASFQLPETAISALQRLDVTNVPLDFISFHDYADDPLAIVDAILLVQAAIQGSTNYRDIELVLGEWGPDLLLHSTDHIYAQSMEPALHAATVVTLGAWAGLDRAHRAIFYNYNSMIALGMLDNNVTPRPLYRAYELMVKLINDNAERLAIENVSDGRMDGGLGAVMVTRDKTDGTIRALLVNRDIVGRTVEVSLNGTVATPSMVYVFDVTDDPAKPLRTISVSDTKIALPQQAIAVVEF